MAEKLERTLSYKTLLLIAVNAIMGTGIFFLPAVGAREAGVVSIISWVLLSLIGIYVAMCFAELASMFPTAGGIYEYSKQAFGSFPSFIIGWGTLIAGNITIAMLVVGAVRYLNPALPEVARIVISLFFILIFNYVAYKGMETSAVMLVTFAFITMGSLALIILPGFLHFDISNLQPFFTHPWSKVFIAMFLIAETFFGWETVTFLAEETKNPRKVIPKALIIGTVAIAIITIVYAVSAIGAVGWEKFGAMEAPLSSLATIFYGTDFSQVFAILVYLSIIGSVAGWIVSAPRLVLSLAKDKLFIAQLAEIHPENKTPHKAIFFQTILTSVLVVVGSGSYEILLSLLLPLVLLLYSAVLVSLVVMRHTKPDMERDYKAPFGKWMPIVVMLAQLALISVWLSQEPGAMNVFQTMLSFLGIGIPIYFLLVFYYNPDAIVGMTDYLSKLTLWLEDLVLPKKLREEILTLFQDIKEKVILEFGAGVGTLTMHLAEEVGEDGKIYATDLSRNNLKILEERLEEAGHTHVEIIHDEHQVNRVHPSIKSVDLVFSVGMLSYLQDVKKVLSEINQLLPEHGKVCFVEYVDFFWFLPNPPWMSDVDKIREVFKDVGFSVYVKKKKGLFWNYLIVYGFKSEKDIPFV